MFLPAIYARVQNTTNEALVIKTDISYILFFSQDADDIDYICTHPEIVRVPDPEILLVFKMQFYCHVSKI